jgi:hypothetical protein
MNAKALKAGVVRGIAPMAGTFEVAVALGADQWVIARVDASGLAACALAVGRPILVDTGAQPIALRPWEARGGKADVRVGNFSLCRP